MTNDATETLASLAHARRSVRGFSPDPLPEALIRRALTIAQQAPSNCNIQPWVVHVVSGEPADRLRAAMHAASAGGEKPRPDFPFSGPYRDLHRARQIDSARILFGAIGVRREDIAGRRDSLLRNYRFFDAPHAAFIFLPEPLGIHEAVDCGMFAQTLMLAFTSLGIACCAQGALGSYPDLVRGALGIAPTDRLLFGISFGREDRDHPANAARVGRATVDEAIMFHG